MTDMDPRRYYDEFGEREWERLDRDPVTRMEFDNTTDYLAELLPESGRVLDAGGGPGRYTCWLAERGREVEHCDLSAEQVRLAPIAEDGDYTAERVAEHARGEGWAECHGFCADEFEAELEAAGFDVEKLVGLENVAARMKRELDEAGDGAVADVREVVRLLREDRTAADCSEHMLAVCRA